MNTIAGDAFRVASGEQQRPFGASGKGDEDGPIRAGRVHHRECVVRELLLDVGLRLRGAIRPAVATTVEGDDAAVASEVGDLELPDPRVDDRPRRQEQNRRLALAVDLVEGPDAVPLDVALGVGVARAALLVALWRDGRCGNCVHVLSSSDLNHASIQASSSSWPSVDPRQSLELDPLVERHHQADQRIHRVGVGLEAVLGGAP